MPNQRKTISAGDLYVMLDRDFRMRQARECGTCYILLPYRVDQPDHSNANWEVILPPDCAFGCSSLVENLVAKYAEAYDLSAGDGND